MVARVEFAELGSAGWSQVEFGSESTRRPVSANPITVEDDKTTLFVKGNRVGDQPVVNFTVTTDPEKTVVEVEGWRPDMLQSDGRSVVPSISGKEGTPKMRAFELKGAQSLTGPVDSRTEMTFRVTHGVSRP